MNRRILWLIVAAAVATVVTTTVAASEPDGPALTSVPSANTKATGYAPPDVLSSQLQQVVVAQGATKVENPGAAISYYGYDNDLLDEQGQPVMVPAGSFTSEAHKTEPDKNTYLVFKDGLRGADPNYDYGTHFLFQGHETGSPGYLTRINLDADPAHRVTLLATTDEVGTTLPDIDGSTWNPFAERLLFTAEAGSNGGVWQATL